MLRLREIADLSLRVEAKVVKNGKTQMTMRIKNNDRLILVYCKEKVDLVYK